MNEELRKAIADYFDPGDFAEFIGVSTMDLINAFEDEVEDTLEEILELMGATPQSPLDGDEEE